MSVIQNDVDQHHKNANDP
jgi:hypothetical protein